MRPIFSGVLIDMFKESKHLIETVNYILHNEIYFAMKLYMSSHLTK